MKGIITILFAFLVIGSNAQNKLGPIGQWRAHFDNHSIEHIVKGGDYVYAASPYQIISIDSKKNNYWIDKTNGLSDINLNQLAWDEIQQQLIIVYANSNIDILKGDQIFNVNALQLTNLYPDKKINTIRIYKQWAILATNFGIVIIDLIKHEVKDNWFPNNNQQPIATLDVLIANDSVYATTSNGLWASAFNANTLQPNQWNRLTGYDRYTLKKLTQYNGNIYGYNNHSFFQLPQTNPFLQFTNATINHVDTSATNLYIGIQYPNQKGALLQLNKDKSVSILIDSSLLGVPKQSVVENNNFWVADSVKGLLLKNNTVQWMPLGGPNARIQGMEAISENELIAPYGALTKGFAKFNESGWTSYQQLGAVQLPNLNASTINNKERSYWFTTNSSIFYISNDNKAENIQPNNLIGAYKQILTDPNNSIWAIQDQQGLVQQANNRWNSIPLPNSYQKNGLNQFIVNEKGQAWLIAPNNQGLYVYQNKLVYPNETWKQFTTQASSGNLPSTNVKSLCKDLSGSIWVGTDNGIGIYNCGDIATEPCNAYLPIVNNNGFNGYLFQKETVNCISVDGANRKWVGTHNGAWLLSADGTEIIEHFTKINSPLPNDTVVQIIIQPNTGEVFINTVNQMVSYRGTATQGKATQSTIQIFPNPISTHFNGQIAMRGLIENALVKITDLNGKLLYQTTALGGQALWNGRNYDGQKVATGIYLVFVRDISGNEKSVGKIVIADGY